MVSHPLKSRSQTSDGDKAEERSIEDNARGAVLIAVAAVSAVNVARVRGRAIGVVVGLLVVGSAGEDTLNVAVAALVARSRLRELVAGLADVGGRGDVKGTLDVVEGRELDPMGLLISCTSLETRQIDAEQLTQ